MKKKQHQRRQVQRIGSSIIEPIELTDYAIVQKRGDEVILRDTTVSTNKREVWFHNQNCSGYCILIGKKHYEFARSYLETL